MKELMGFVTPAFIAEFNSALMEFVTPAFIAEFISALMGFVIPAYIAEVNGALVTSHKARGFSSLPYTCIN